MNPPRTVMLRPALVSEAGSMAEMSRHLIEAGLGWRYTPQRIAALIRHAETIALVAHDTAGFQGFAVMQFSDEQAHLVLLCVQPALRQRGIGRRLMDWLLQSARVAGIESIALELRADNAAALAFYRRLGFAQTQLVPAYYEGRVPAQRMSLQLRVAGA
jgi:ribosomal protein S18 acetylase RimI-like enzyme